MRLIVAYVRRIMSFRIVLILLCMQTKVWPIPFIYVYYNNCYSVFIWAANVECVYLLFLFSFFFADDKWTCESFWILIGILYICASTKCMFRSESVYYIHTIINNTHKAQNDKRKINYHFVFFFYNSFLIGRAISFWINYMKFNKISGLFISILKVNINHAIIHIVSQTPSVSTKEFCFKKGQHNFGWSQQ